MGPRNGDRCRQSVSTPCSDGSSKNLRRYDIIHSTKYLLTAIVLTSYSSLRSFVDVNSQQPEGQKYIIKNYSLCAIYTQDLFSAYMRFKSMWKELSEIMKNGHLYKPREKSEQCPDPIQVTPRSLNEARLQARKYMVVIAKETTRLIREPERADLDENGEVKEVPYEWPGVLQSRMPVSKSFSSFEENMQRLYS